ncbi:MAG: hypothetical protein PHW53_05235, partial [Patescibacteria group bacterium]|nr:hypothetical protein [Patescibacteria group bacterium]
IACLTIFISLSSSCHADGLDTPDPLALYNQNPPDVTVIPFDYDRMYNPDYNHDCSPHDPVYPEDRHELHTFKSVPELKPYYLILAILVSAAIFLAGRRSLR